MAKQRIILLLLGGVLLYFMPAVPTLSAASKPNVILIMTDDQGYGDLSAHGNPVLKTPHLDTLRDESVRFTDFHVAPKCTPTRGQLMTGLDAMRNGATRVCQGLSMVFGDIKMMPEYFAESGYATGMFGKWHLGDAYPHRPRFRGFQEVVSFRAWGITSLADHWMNSYFDPVLMHNGVDKEYKGYCTDIFFDEAMKWMRARQAENQPFFVYLPTNTPHVPNVVADRYSDPYIGQHDGKPMPAKFYGMIANIDENIGRLEAFLEETGLRDNTILVFLSDNGTQSKEAHEIYSAGMRDRKGSLMEGGHRVPLFVRWIDGKLEHGKDIAELAVVQDLLPTVVDLCGLNCDAAHLDGQSLAPLLTGRAERLEDRISVTQFGPRCGKWEQAVVMKEQWRLLPGNRLYNIADDPHQDRNVADAHPEVVQELTAYYDKWFAETKPAWDQPRQIILGNPAANPVILYASDWRGDYCDNRGGLIDGKGRGYWDVIVEQAGTYEFELRRWPKESGKALTEPFDDRPWAAHSARPIARARLIVGETDQTVDTRLGDTVVTFTANLKAGRTQVRADFLDKDGQALCGAMYVTVTRKLKDEWSTFPLYDQVGYDQALRPQFHFTSRMGWLNDPNGMVYSEAEPSEATKGEGRGEWHMYFQHYAKGNASGAKSWGSAVSKDLMHWEQLPHAINPYPKVDGSEGIHAIWSGSAVVDVLNALGKQEGDTKTLFALYSATHEKFFQGGVYSTDRGRTWTKINGGKPVIPHQQGYSKGQRDPRIFYFAPGKCYYTIMMIGGPERKVRLWKSTNLLDWEQAFDIPNKAAECIDMYQAAVDGDPHNRKWVIADAGTHYEVGNFDGETWTGYGSKDEAGKRLRFDYGDAYYAAQVFNQAPGGRAVHIGWLRSKQPGYRPFLEAGMPFTQQMSIPAEITLRTTPEGIRMFRNPVKEIETLYQQTHRFSDLAAKALNEKLRHVRPELVDLTLRFKPTGDLALNVRGLRVEYLSQGNEFKVENRKRVEGIRKAWNRDYPFRDNGIRRILAPPVDGVVTLRVLVDRASLELFVNDGAAAASFVMVPEADNRTIAIEGDDRMTLDSLEVHELRSAWIQQGAPVQ